MNQDSDDLRLRGLVEYYFRRNRHLSTVHDAEDLFQDTWIDLHQREPNHPVPEDPIPDNSRDCDASAEETLRRAARRAADRVFGRLRKRLTRGGLSDKSLDFEPAGDLPDLGLVFDLKQLIEALPLEERQVIELLRSGYAGTEIAEQLQVSPQAVTRRKQKAIERLRQMLCES